MTCRAGGSTVGVLSIILGLALLGVLADVVVENDVMTAVREPITIAGTTQTASAPAIAIIAFAAGALAVVLIVLGIRRLRHAGRAQLQERIRALQDENARLHTQRNLQNIIRIPEAVAEPTVDERPVAPAASEMPRAEKRPPDQPASSW
jgi:hypothetical protein